MTNTSLNPETRKELLQLYSKIYGKPEVTNMGESVDLPSAAASKVGCCNPDPLLIPTNCTQGVEFRPADVPIEFMSLLFSHKLQDMH